jgi:hypothetical protein
MDLGGLSRSFLRSVRGAPGRTRTSDTRFRNPRAPVHLVASCGNQLWAFDSHLIPKPKSLACPVGVHLTATNLPTRVEPVTLGDGEPTRSRSPLRAGPGR